MKKLKYIKLYEQMFNDTILYHGSPYLYEKFKQKLTFFSDNINFVKDYAEDKSSAMGLDQTPVIYECSINAKIFDATNPEHLSKLENVLPDTVKCYMTNFCFPHDFSKSDMLELLKGVDTVEPPEFANANIGDKVPDPSYKQDLFIIVDKDVNYIYTVLDRNMRHALDDATNFTYNKKYSDFFTEFKTYVKDLFKRTAPKKYIDTDKMCRYFFDIKEYNVYDSTATDEEYKKGVELYDDAVAKFNIAYAEENKKKWSLKPYKIKLTDTWRYFENDVITDLIRKLGYCGYKALENGHNTYGIFDPFKSVKIISIQYDGDKYDSISEIKEVTQLCNKIYQFDKKAYIPRWEVYKMWKDGLSIDEMIEKTMKKQ